MCLRSASLFHVQLLPLLFPLYIECYGVRHTVALMTFVGIATVYTMRTALSVTIVSMVGSSFHRRGSTNGTCSLDGSNSSSEDCLNITEGEFSWDDKTVGLILGSFYYGYVCTMLLGGRIGDYFGGRIPFGISIFLTSVLMLLCPTAARISPKLLIVVQIARGVVDGCGFPGTYKLTVMWYPQQERSKFISYIFSGIQLGIVVSMSVSGWLCSSSLFGGWPAVFYFFGGFGVIWSILWFSTVYEDPSKHPRIQEAELQYIKQGCSISKMTNRIPVPWRSIMTSKVVWVIIVMNFGNNWLLFTNLIQLPKYFDDFLHINIRDNGVFSALPFLGSLLVRILSGYILTYFLSRGTISLLSVRRISVLISGYSTAALLIILSYLNYAPLIIITSLLIVSLLGAGSCGFMCSHGDISPRFAGTLFGLTNTFGCMPGILSPLFTGFLLHYYGTEWGWRITFILASLLAGIASTIYIFCITTNIQPWNEPTSKEVLSYTTSSNTVRNTSAKWIKSQEFLNKLCGNCRKSQSISEKNYKLTNSVVESQMYVELAKEAQTKRKLMGKPDNSLIYQQRSSKEYQDISLNINDQRKFAEDSEIKLDKKIDPSLASTTFQEHFKINCQSAKNFEKVTNIDSKSSKQIIVTAALPSSTALYETSSVSSSTSESVQIAISSESSEAVKSVTTSSSAVLKAKSSTTEYPATRINLISSSTVQPLTSSSAVQPAASSSEVKPAILLATVAYPAMSSAVVQPATSSLSAVRSSISLSATKQPAASLSVTTATPSAVQIATSAAAAATHTTTSAQLATSSSSITKTTIQTATLSSLTPRSAISSLATQSSSSATAASSLATTPATLSNSLTSSLNMLKFITRKKRKVYFISN